MWNKHRFCCLCFVDGFRLWNHQGLFITEIIWHTQGLCPEFTTVCFLYRRVFHSVFYACKILSGSNFWGWSNFLAHPPAPGGFLTRLPSVLWNGMSKATWCVSNSKQMKEKDRPFPDCIVISCLCCVLVLVSCLYIRGPYIVYSIPWRYASR